MTDGLIRPERPGPLPTVAWQFPGEAPRFALDGAVYTAAAAVDWAKSLGLFADYAALDRFDAPPAIDRGLFFLPALAGLACPHWDRRARGAWFGLTLDHGPDDLMQSLLEGVALRLAEALSAIDALQPVGRLSVDGGMARNPYLLGFLASIIRQPITRAQETETTALGLAHMLLRARGMQVPSPDQPSPVAPLVPADAARLMRFARLRDAAALMQQEPGR